MEKKDIYNFLNEKGINYEVMEHKAVFNMEEAFELNLPHPESEAKNLFVIDKKKNYYFITIKGDKKINLKDFKLKNNIKSISFASEKDLLNILNLIPGGVSPLGLLNDKDLKVKYYIDKEFTGDNLIGVHPNDNTATIWLKVEDLIKIIKEHGNEVKQFET